MKYIPKNKMDRIEELSNKGWNNYSKEQKKLISMEGMIKGQMGCRGAGVNGLSESEIQELREYNFVTSDECFEMKRNGEWGTPTTLPNGRVYML